MKKLFDRYGKREVITNMILIAVLLVLTCGLGFSYYIKQEQNKVANQNTGSGVTTTPTITPSETSVPEVISPEQTPGPIETTTPVAPTPTSTPESTPTPEVNFTDESQVVAYFSSQEEAIDSYQSQGNDSSILDKVKSGFISVVDFLFYDQPIGGYTFSQLTNKAKVQIIKIALSIDHKIDQYFPGYKDSIKAGYTSVKAKLVKLYLDTTALLCEKVGDATCNQAKADFATMKDSFGFTFDLIKDAGGNLVDAIKTWYEIFSGKQ